MGLLDRLRKRPARVSVREAWLAHERYAGRPVAVGGVVRAFGAGAAEYFALDDGPDRVGIRGDADLLRASAGRRVCAIGHLTFKPGVGIFLDAAELRTED